MEYKVILVFFLSFVALGNFSGDVVVEYQIRTSEMSDKKPCTYYGKEYTLFYYRCQVTFRPLSNSTNMSEKCIGELKLQAPCDFEMEGKELAFSESERTTVAAPGLVNCSWYSTNACCKRTEVTSVFSKMYPLYGASLACRNRINYMMCYFCSPLQMIWYRENDKRVHICLEFCSTVYEHCKDARYNGKSIGQEYDNSSAFCEAQNFHIVNGKDNCFNFDPTVFDRSSMGLPHLTLIITLLSFLYLFT